MTDFYRETVRKITDLTARVRILEGRKRPANVWLHRVKILPVAANTLNGNSVGYVAMDPTPVTTDLNTISNGRDGQGLFLRVEDSGDTVTVKDSVGNISLPFSGDIVLDDEDKVIFLIYDANAGVSGLWLEVKSS